MRALLKLISLLVLLSPLVVVAVAWFALADVPLVEHQVTLSHEDIARAKKVLKENDPRYLPKGARRTIEISSQDLNLAANYLTQKALGGHALFTLQQDRLEASVSLQVPRLPWRPHLNIETVLASGDNGPRIARMQIGSLPIPPALATWATKQVLVALYNQKQIDSLTNLVDSLELYPDRLRLTYRWSPSLIEQARDTLLTDTDREALRTYYDLLIDLQDRNIGRSGSLVELLAAMFEKALLRSREGDPVEENVALLTVLGTWASRQDITRLMPTGGRRAHTFRLKLQGRIDFAQHFLTSAAIAARGDTTLSDAVGLFKEISDTDRGSGFSFTDIAADRAGTRFGEFASRSSEHARRLQQRLADGIAETEIMPPARDLPEHMHGDDFERRFQHIGSPAYQQLMAEIEQRIDACALYRD